MATIGRQGGRRSINIWPGFVDGLATLLLVVIFVLMVFMVAQYFLSNALSGREAALQRLNQQIAELSELLALEQETNAELRITVARLSSQLQSTLGQRDSLSAELARLSERESELESRLLSAETAAARAEDVQNRLLAELEAAQADAIASREEELEARRRLGLTREELAQLRRVLQEREAAFAAAEDTARRLEETVAERERIAIIAGDLRQELESAYKTIEADKEKIEAQLAELAILKDLRDQYQDRLDELDIAMADRARVAALLRQEAAAARTAAGETGDELRATTGALDGALELNEEQRRQLELLNRQILALRQQIANLSEVLEVTEAENAEQKVQIADLGRRLNIALASKVQELARYRSEFFGRLREVLGEREDIRIVGDRFVFQSELFFETGSARLEPQGRAQLGQLATTLLQIASDIPSDIDWILQVEGHTDIRPIATPEFPSNWELSTARAVSVVKFLRDQGIPPERLVAAGFGEFQPLETEETETAYRRNRRIELKLTSR